MADNYLQLVTDLLMETGLSGGSAPSGIATATGDQKKAAYWIKVANNQIQREWKNWDFLYTFAPQIEIASGSQVFPSFGTGTGDFVIGGQTVTLTLNDINMVIRKSVGIINGTEVHFPAYMDWFNTDFRNDYTVVAQTASDTPSYYSIMPPVNGARQIILSSPIASSGLFQTYNYYRKPRVLAVDADVSYIPDDFTRIIVVLAKIMYAEHEDAPEVSAGSHEEYDFLLSEMQAAHLPDQGFNRESDSDADLVVQPE